MIDIYYGMSGALKSTTIKRTYPEGKFVVMKSDIKVWKNNRDLVFPWLKETETNLNYALLHLTRLEDYIKGNWNYVIERGITDMMFYEKNQSPETINDAVIIRATNREKEIIGKNNNDLQKILLIMKDRKFIAENVLSEKTRADWFDGVQDYLQKQDEYVEFTKKYNQIDKEIVIDDAKTYLAKLRVKL